MAKKFNLYEALKADGFEATELSHCSTLTRSWFVDKRAFKVEVWFNIEKTVCEADYFDGGRRPFKKKVHLTDKRAYNAIRQTVANNGFKY